VSLGTGRIEGLEALVRWPHPTLGLLPPARFLDLAERAGLIGELTSFALDAALRECRTWLDAGLEIQVAVNLPRPRCTPMRSWTRSRRSCTSAACPGGSCSSSSRRARSSPIP
jgi:EAL domain-containing protein (putative c-di-GMP-specific phosphodiesterase class I)